jgi:hypothetical protein
MRDKWRIGRQVPINVYEGDRPICQCHTATDARRIVEAVNRVAELQELVERGQDRGRKKSEPEKANS